MSKQDINQFFAEYVFGFMFSDIQREIDLAKSGCNAGNFHSALGLLCYTEVLGSIKQTSLSTKKKPTPKSNFDAFFADLGSNYAAFAQTVNVYDVFRSGMAHEYLVKRNCAIAILKGNEP